MIELAGTPALAHVLAHCSAKGLSSAIKRHPLPRIDKSEKPAKCNNLKPHILYLQLKEKNFEALPNFTVYLTGKD